MSEEQAILKGIYPIISSSLSKNTTKFKKLIARFIENVQLNYLILLHVVEYHF